MLHGDLTILNYINDINDVRHHESTETLLESAADFPDKGANRNKIDAIAKKNNRYPYRSVVGLLINYLQVRGENQDFMPIFAVFHSVFSQNYPSHFILHTQQEQDLVLL